MIKLIVSDMDGTLLPEGTPNMNPEIYTVIKQLREKGIIVVIASGRQYLSMTDVLEPVKEDIIYISDNGAYGIQKGRVLECRNFRRELLRDIVTYVRSLDQVFLLAATPEHAYTDIDDPDMIRWIREGYNLDVELVEDVLALQEPVLKIAVYCQSIDAAKLAIPAKEIFKGRAHIMASGSHWVDFMEEGVDKGAAVKSLQKRFGILPEETMAFGDNNNDIGLLQSAVESYAVATARPEVKAAAKYVLEDTSQDAVLNILKSFYIDFCKE